jgi:predicted signal transduction protein with EAL and GGDEF domain
MTSAQTIASRIVAAIGRPFGPIGGGVGISASVGIAVFPDDGDCAEMLLTNADIAMRAAKDDGRNDYRFFDAAMHAQALERRRVEVGLGTALTRQQLFLHYQPKWNLITGTVIGAEALLRWTHPDLGDVPPGHFIPVAEETGQIIPIGEFVFREACASAMRWQRSNTGAIPVSVNLSVRQFRDVDLVSKIESILGDCGLDLRLLEIELTEGLLMDDVRRSIAALGRLKALGVGLSIDDFGTGYSSFGQLRRIPVDTVKIDRSFLADFDAAGVDETIIATIISMARSLDLKVIAEGVETREQLSLLETLGCDQMQGFLLGHPSPAEQMDVVLDDPSSAFQRIREDWRPAP